MVAVNVVLAEIGFELTLESSQSILPSMGADIPQLTVLVEQQTRSRLHIKISSLDGNRWEVPEEVVQR